MSLKEYNRKRRFDATPEPKGEDGSADDRGDALKFVVQMHAATRLHFDLRLEIGGAFRSWAVPKGPTQNPNEQRLAVKVEDHPLAYGSFEGVIPKGNYGAGTVMIWDAGRYLERSSTGREDSEKAMAKGFEAGHLTFVVTGRRLAGEFALIRLEKDKTGKSWLLVKKRDEYADYKADMEGEAITSVATGRTMAEIAREAPAKGEIWRPGKGPDDVATLQDVANFSPPKRAAKAKKSRVPPPASPVVGGVATKEVMPRKVSMMLPSIRVDDAEDLPPDEWIFEPRFDGQRTIAVVEPGRATLTSRQGLSFNARYSEISKTLASLRCKAIFDGEIVVMDDEGQLSAPLLKSYARSKGGKPVFMVYDLLHLDGMNLRELSLEERRRRLAEVGPLHDASVRLAPNTADRAVAAAQAASIGASGLMARNKASPYAAGTSSYWLKLPAADGGTAGGSRSTPPPLADVPVTHSDRIYWPKERLTKGDLIAYYRQVANLMVPHLQDRPHSLHRHPQGIEAEGFYQKDLSGYHPPWVDTVGLRAGGRTVEYLVCRNAATILYMANLGCIEINPWLSRTSDLERPDYAVIDLDPDKQDFDDVVRLALAVRRELETRNIESFVKTSGASGMHIFIPLKNPSTYRDAQILTEEICRDVETRLPELSTMERNPDRRRGKIYLDCGQNRRGQTLAAAYSVRPRPGAPVSTPLTWSEVTPGLHPSSFTIATVLRRLDAVGDLWAPLGKAPL